MLHCPALRDIGIVGSAEDHRRFIWGQAYFDPIQSKGKAFAPSFEIGLLPSPCTIERFPLLSGWQGAQLSKFIRGKKALRQIFDIDSFTDALQIDTDSVLMHEADQSPVIAMRNAKTHRRCITGKVRFAKRIIAELQPVWLTRQM